MYITIIVVFLLRFLYVLDYLVVNNMDLLIASHKLIPKFKF